MLGSPGHPGGGFLRSQPVGGGASSRTRVSELWLEVGGGNIGRI